MNRMRTEIHALLAIIVVSGSLRAQVGAPYDRPAGAVIGPSSVLSYGPNRHGRMGFVTNGVPTASVLAPQWPPFWPGFVGFRYPFGVWGDPIPVPTPVGLPGSEDPPRPFARILPPQYLSSAVAAQHASEVAGRVEVSTALTIELPHPGKVWEDGRLIEESDSQSVLCLAPSLNPGENHTFRIRAIWTRDGRDYEYTRTLTLSFGERKSLTVFHGTELSKAPD